MSETDFKKVRLFKVSKELNVSIETLMDHLKIAGHKDSLSGSGINAAITDEDAYLDLLDEFADDKEVASRIRKKRAAREEAEALAMGDGAEAEAVVAPTPVPEPEPEPVVEVVPEPEPAPEPEPEPEPELIQEPEPVVEPQAAEEAPAEAVAPPATEDVPAELPSVESATEAVPEAPAVETPPSESVEQAAEAVAPEEVEPEASASTDAVDKTGRVDETGAVDTTGPVDESGPVDEAGLVDAAGPVDAAGETEAPKDDAVASNGEVIAAVEGEENAEAPIAIDPASLILADRYKLAGTKIIGKIDLTKVEDDSPAARKQKRKRIDKGGKAPKAPGGAAAGKSSKTDKKAPKKKAGPVVDSADVEKTLQETLRELEAGASRARQRRRRARRDERSNEREEEAARQAAMAGVLRVTEFVSTGELANLLGIGVNEIISSLFKAGMMVSINQRLDADTITFVSDEFGREVEFITEFSSDDLIITQDDPEDLLPRAPVVTVMGHVDHGKTSLLDYIRHASVVAGEAGGITQHIGAYNVVLENSRDVTFLDTPGHEAFTAMRARGAQVTDIVILVVAADDAVMPQTVEAINHARAAGVPIVVAINKVDKANANVDRVMQQLGDQNVLVEQWGGKIQCALVSAKTGDGVTELMEKVLLEADLLELTANPDRLAVGVVIESRLEKGRGTVATILVQNGTLRVGDTFVTGVFAGKVRAMYDERDRRILEVGPARPALVSGLDGAPNVGDSFIAVEEEREAREIAAKRQQIQREQSMRQRKHITLDEIGRRLALGDFQELNLIVKGDVGGSVEAVADSLLKLSTEEVAVNIVHKGVGAINESDVVLASASDAIIIGFQVRPMPGARQLAEQEEIDIRLYSVIYNAIEEVRDALEGLLSPERSESILGVAEVRETFKVPKVGMIAGCSVTEGKIKRSDRIHLIRDGVVIYEGTLASLKRFKDDVREVVNGYECGMGIENFNDLKVGDQIEAYVIVETRRTLEV